jgi:membrane protein DedA with SNARE-associated domain
VTWLTTIPASIGYPVLFLLVMGESAGLPIPGESSIMVAAVSASQGTLSIAIVLIVGASAAIIGDNIGYWLGRRYGKRLWLAGSWGRDRRQRWLDEADGFLDRHGSVAVVIGRWLPVARFTVAWLAGINRMHWPRFVLWNAVGGISWVVTVGMAAYLIGSAAENAVSALGFVGLAGLILGFAGHWAWRRQRVARA